MQKLDILECLKPRSALTVALLCFLCTLIPHAKAYTLTKSKHFYQWSNGGLQPYKITKDDLKVVETFNYDDNMYAYRLQIKPNQPKILVYKNPEGKENDNVVRTDDAVIFLNPEQGYDLNMVLETEEPQRFSNIDAFISKLEQNGNIYKYFQMPYHTYERWDPQLMADTLFSNKLVLKTLATKKFSKTKIEGYDGVVYGLGTYEIQMSDQEIGSAYFIYAKNAAWELIKTSFQEIIVPRRTEAVKHFGNYDKMFANSISDISSKLVPILEEGLTEFSDDTVQYVLMDFLPKAVYNLFNPVGFAKFMKSLDKTDTNLIFHAIQNEGEALKPTNLGFQNYQDDLGVGAVLTSWISDSYKEDARQKMEPLISTYIKGNSIKNLKTKQRKILNETASKINAVLGKYKCAYEVESELNPLIEQILEHIDIFDFVLDSMIEKIYYNIEEFVRSYINYSLKYTLLRKLAVACHTYVQIDGNIIKSDLESCVVRQRSSHYAKMMGFNAETVNENTEVPIFEEHRTRLIVI